MSEPREVPTFVMLTAEDGTSSLINLNQVMIVQEPQEGTCCLISGSGQKVNITGAPAEQLLTLLYATAILPNGKTTQQLVSEMTDAELEAKAAELEGQEQPLILKTPKLPEDLLPKEEKPYPPTEYDPLDPKLKGYDPLESLEK